MGNTTYRLVTNEPSWTCRNRVVLRSHNRVVDEQVCRVDGPEEHAATFARAISCLPDLLRFFGSIRPNQLDAKQCDTLNAILIKLEQGE